MKLNQISRGGGGDLRENPFHRGGIDIIWNYTLKSQCVTLSGRNQSGLVYMLIVIDMVQFKEIQTKIF